MRYLLTAILLLTLGLRHHPLAAQTLKEGVMEMKMEFLNLPEEMQQFAAMMQQSTTRIYFKGERSRTETGSFGMSIVVLSQADGGMVQLIDGGGKKLAVRYKPGEQEKGKTKASIELLPGTRTILGRVCKKANITFEEAGQKQKVLLYYTEELKLTRPRLQQLPEVELPGFPMGMEFSMQEFTARMEVSRLEETPVAESLFSIPAGYTEITPEKFQQEMGRGMVPGMMPGMAPGTR